jgi:hypothetical protein
MKLYEILRNLNYLQLEPFHSISTKPDEKNIIFFNPVYP